MRSDGPETIACRSIEHAERRNRELTNQIEDVLGIREEADLRPLDLKYEGKADQVLLVARTQQLVAIGGYCQHLRDRVCPQ